MPFDTKSLMLTLRKKAKLSHRSSLITSLHLWGDPSELAETSDVKLKSVGGVNLASVYLANVVGESSPNEDSGNKMKSSKSTRSIKSFFGHSSLSSKSLSQFTLNGTVRKKPSDIMRILNGANQRSQMFENGLNPMSDQGAMVSKY